MKRQSFSLSIFALAIAASALLSAPTAAQSSPEARDERAAERNRVLELATGEHVRAMTRWVADAAEPEGGRWELREKGAWRPLDRGEVSGWRDERDLLHEAERLARALPPDEVERRVALADWMVSHGLEAEAVAQLDRVLDARPDFDAALVLLARGEFERPYAGDPRTDPNGVRERLIALGVTQSPARRELVIRALGELPDEAALRAALLRELVAYRHRERVFAAHALRRSMPGEELRPLVERAALDNSSEVRYGAALALRASGKDGVIVPLVRALDSRNPLVRNNAAEALGNVGFPAAVPALVNRMATLAQAGAHLRPAGGFIAVTNQVAIVSDYDVEIAQAASIADPKISVAVEGAILEGRAYGMQEQRLVTEFQTVRSSLKLLTGDDAGKTPDDWTRWYDEHRGQYEKPAAKPAPPVTGE